MTLEELEELYKCRALSDWHVSRLLVIAKLAKAANYGVAMAKALADLEDEDE